MKTDPIEPSTAVPGKWLMAYAWTAVLALTYALTAHFITFSLETSTVLAADTQIFREHMARLFSGQLPYIDFPFEHFPLAIAPMAIGNAVAPSANGLFTVVFAVVMFGVLAATGAIVQRTGSLIGVPNGGRRWILLTAFLLPLVLFRVDPVSVFFVALALLLAVNDRQPASAASLFAGIAAKGWPVVLVPVMWWRGHRRQAVLVVFFTAVLAGALLATPGFRSGRSFVGVHQETVSGSILVLARLLRGEPSGLVDAAGAVYVEAGVLALLTNLAVGGSLAIAGLFALRHRFTMKAGIALSATLTFAVMFASPLLSAQFLLWPTPFLALVSTRWARLLFVAASIITIGLLTIWSPSSTPWHIGLVLRNGALLGAAALTAYHGIRLSAQDTEAARTSRK